MLWIDLFPNMSWRISMNNIFIQSSELKDFHLKLTNKGRVRKFWEIICEEMPHKLRVELSKKPTNLKYYTQGEMYEVYRWITEGGTKQLDQYLDKFRVFVEYSF